jgi:hypothetical protein
VQGPFAQAANNRRTPPATSNAVSTRSALSTCIICLFVVYRGPSRKLRPTGTPHQLNSASLIIGPAARSSSSSSSSADAAGLEVSPLTGAGSSNGDAAAAAAPGAEQPVSRAFDQPGLQLELGYNLAGGTPILSASRRFGSNSSSSSTPGVLGSSSSWQLRQLKAAYDGKSNNVTLSAAGAAWSLGVVFPTEATGPLGMPRKPSSSNGWPRLMLSLQPDVSFEAM